MKNNFLGYVESRHHKRPKFFRCYLCSGTWICNRTSRCPFCESANIKVLPVDMLRLKDLKEIEYGK